MVWNVLEVGVTIALGVAAGSLALVAFGLDSVVEICASTAVLWQLRTRTAGRTLRAMAVVGLAFFALAVILIGAAVETLVAGREAGESPLGAAYLAITAIVMFSLAYREAAPRRTPRQPSARDRSPDHVPRRVPCDGCAPRAGGEHRVRMVVGRPDRRGPRRYRRGTRGCRRVA